MKTFFFVTLILAASSAMAFGADKLSVANTDVLVDRDIEYVAGGGKAQSLDVYYPAKSDGPLPLLIYIHGGGWEAGNKDGCWCLPETARGYVAASINYRLSQQAIFPAQIQDCKAAIRWLRGNAKKYNIDPDHIGVWGDSAGGHLCALLGVTGGSKEFEAVGGNLEESDRVQAVCDWYGPTNFPAFAAQSGPDAVIRAEKPDSPLSKLFGGPPSQKKDAALAASPVHHVSKDCPPFLIEHGTVDNIVPIAQSEELADLLEKAGVEVTFRKHEGKGHGNGMVNAPGWLKPIETFFDKHLKTAKP